MLEARPLDPTGDCRQLHEKYVEMLAMRLDHLAGADDERAARARMMGLASRFPGALRELDTLELEVIEGRIVALAAVLRGDGRVEAWMEAAALFHVLARGALAAKRWLGGRKAVDAAVVAAFRDEVAGLPFPDEARAWAADLARVASPPRGRIVDLVLVKAAARLGITRSEARALIFGVLARRRR